MVSDGDTVTYTYKGSNTKPARGVPDRYPEVVQPHTVDVSTVNKVIVNYMKGARTSNGGAGRVQNAEFSVSTYDNIYVWIGGSDGSGRYPGGIGDPDPQSGPTGDFGTTEGGAGSTEIAFVNTDQTDGPDQPFICGAGGDAGVADQVMEYEDHPIAGSGGRNPIGPPASEDIDGGVAATGEGKPLGREGIFGLGITIAPDGAVASSDRIISSGTVSSTEGETNVNGEVKLTFSKADPAVNNLSLSFNLFENGYSPATEELIIDFEPIGDGRTYEYDLYESTTSSPSFPGDYQEITDGGGDQISISAGSLPFNIVTGDLGGLINISDLTNITSIGVVPVLQSGSNPEGLFRSAEVIQDLTAASSLGTDTHNQSFGISKLRRPTFSADKPGLKNSGDSGNLALFRTTVPATDAIFPDHYKKVTESSDISNFKDDTLGFDTRVKYVTALEDSNGNLGPPVKSTEKYVPPEKSASIDPDK